MVTIGRRMNKLKSVLKVRSGPGAAVFPETITRIHMEFAHKGGKQHIGPQKFWRSYLPQLKYWNPAVPMIVNRVRDASIDPTMKIYMRKTGVTPATAAAGDKQLATYQPSSDADGNSKAPEPEAHETVATIPLTHVMQQTILKTLLEQTMAVPVPPTLEDEEEIQRLAELSKQAVIDRATMKAHIDAGRREKRMIEKARKEADSIKMANGA